jgi:hypothetical protein
VGPTYSFNLRYMSSLSKVQWQARYHSLVNFKIMQIYTKN